ncbi:MAG: hypothetical protein ABS35_43090 [Kaistia sp. SCN 65-12]|nr:MAG: hypothetical protein ABS35_43090 [Kaistia sp. SCN 65-12]
MSDIPEHVQRRCDEFSIRIVSKQRYPGPGETRAVATIDRIWRKFGEDHLRLVLTTLVETANNKILLDEIGLWMASDMVRKCQSIIDERAGEWLELWDAMPAGDLQFVSQELRGHVSQRAALGGMIYERIYRRFGPFADQLNLFDDLRRK